MVNTINQSFTEVYDIILHSELELVKKIPASFIDMIKSNRDKEYKVNIDYSKSINEQELLHDTKIIMSLIYRDYLCSEEEREILIAQDKKALAEYEEELREKYNVDNLFKDKTVKNTTTTIQNAEENAETAVREYKETIFAKIRKFISNFFH